MGQSDQQEVSHWVLAILKDGEQETKPVSEFPNWLSEERGLSQMEETAGQDLSHTSLWVLLDVLEHLWKLLEE